MPFVRRYKGLNIGLEAYILGYSVDLMKNTTISIKLQVQDDDEIDDLSFPIFFLTQNEINSRLYNTPQYRN